MRGGDNTPLKFVITFCVFVFIILCVQSIGLYFFAHGNIFMNKTIEFEQNIVANTFVEDDLIAMNSSRYE